MDSSELLNAGVALANAAYNLAQSPRLTDTERRSLNECRRAWDAAVTAAPPPPAEPPKELIPWSDYWQSQGRIDVSHDFDTFRLAEQWVLASISAAAPPPAEQASGEHGKHMAVLERLERALPDVGLNGWIDGVAAVQYARATLSQRPVVCEDIIASTLSGMRGSDVVWDEDRRTARLLVSALAPQQPTGEEG